MSAGVAGSGELWRPAAASSASFSAVVGVASRSAFLSALLSASLAASSGCTQETGPAPVLVGVTPVRAYSTTAVVLTVTASIESMVRPSLFVDVPEQSVSIDETTVRISLVPAGNSGAPPVPLGPVRWDRGVSFLATIPAGLEKGLYDVTLESPKRKPATLPAAFEEVGVDEDAPTLSVSYPGVDAILLAGVQHVATISANDGLGQVHDLTLETSAGLVDNTDCVAHAAVPGPMGGRPSNVSCNPTFTPPALADGEVTAPFWVRATARDVAGQTAPSEVLLSIAHQPLVDGFASQVGSLTGRQRFEVHGHFFVPGSQVRIGGIPIIGSVPGGDVVDDTTIVGETPPHTLAETLMVDVLTPVSTLTAMGPVPVAVVPGGSFRYVAPPRIRTVFPATGPTSGGIRVTVGGNDLLEDVTILFGTSLESARPLGGSITYVEETKVRGCLPPGEGTVSVWARDSITGVGQFANAFSYADPGPGDPPPLLDPTCPTVGLSAAAVTRETPSPAAAAR